MIRPSEWLERLNVADLRPEAKELLQHMLHHAREKGGYGVQVPDEYLVAATGCSPKAVIDHLYSAFQKGWLIARAYSYGTRPQSSTAYILSMPPEKQKARKPRVTRKKKAELTLHEWEQQNGILVVAMMQSWVKQNLFCERTVHQLIEEFRTEMKSKGNLYADFKATFQTYLNKGYLSKKRDQVLLVNSPYAPKVGAMGKAMEKGVSL